MMPDRVVRDELLESPRWLALDDNAHRIAFVCLLLTADDCGNVEGEPVQLRRLWRDYGIDKLDAVEQCVRALGKVDLARVYTVGEKRYLHLPRFRQRVRYQRRGHPLSPWNDPAEMLRRDDGTIKGLRKKSPTQVRPKSDSSQPKRSEVKKKGSSSTVVGKSKFFTAATAVSAHARENPGSGSGSETPQETGHVKGNGETPPLDNLGTIVERIPCNDGTEFEVRETLLREWERLYPHVEVAGTLREIRGYNLANPDKRKPAGKVLAHIDTWLRKEQAKC